jgi:hypothetical protein
LVSELLSLHVNKYEFNWIIVITINSEYASVVWNSIMSTDPKKLESIQQRFAALCFNRFFPGVYYGYSLVLEELKFHIQRLRRHRLDAIFLIQIYFGFKFCPSVLEIVGLRVPARYVSGFALFTVCSSCKIVSLLNVHQLLVLFAGTLIYSEPARFSSIFFIMCYKFYYYYDFRACTYKYYSFSPPKGLTMAWVLILIFWHLNYHFYFTHNYNYCIILSINVFSSSKFL